MMFRLLLCCCLLVSSLALAGDKAAATPLSEAIKRSDYTFHLTGNGRGLMSAKISNHTDKTTSLSIPGALVFAAATGEKQVTIRSANIDLPAGVETEVLIPTAGLSSKNTDAFREVKLSSEAGASLQPLIALFETQPDLPRNTAQLAVFIATEDISLSRWLDWLLVPDTEKVMSRPTPTEVTQIVDALAFVKLAFTDRKPSLLLDEKLKRLTLRNPHSRTKAAALYGIVIDDVQPGDVSAAPDLKQLLHITPGDNCPICRQRQDMQKDNGL